ncbi:MAG: phosphatidylserine decarboxylase, partial [Clostridia bacterium]|nr:phosphatidylserine decarboxylase [Deltaproteobacteria bacterium]
SRLLDDSDEAKRYEGGAYVTLYLAPNDYHRIHSPVSGTVARATVVPGALMPVFAEALERVDELFARNERLVSYVDGAAGRVAVVKVGATLVGRISVVYDTSLRTNQKKGSRRSVTYDPPHAIQKGAELGAFELGSTVIVIAEAGRVELVDLHGGDAVRMGQRIGTIVSRKPSRKRKASS